jgi:hypothetical protein
MSWCRSSPPESITWRPTSTSSSARRATGWTTRSPGRAEGLQLTSRVGDPGIALGAIANELWLSGADEALISTLPRSKSNWVETGIVERLRVDLDIPVTHTVVDLDGARTTAER